VARRSGKPTCCRSTCRRSIGLSTSGGFEYQLEALEGQDPAAIGSVTSGLIGAANRDPRLTRVFSTFTAHHPSGLSRHRPRQGAGARPQHQRRLHRAAGNAWRHLRQQLQSLRPTWQVNVQGEAANRGDISDIWQIYVRKQHRPDGTNPFPIASLRS